MARFPTRIPLWAQVIVIPEDNKIIVFNKGSPHGSTATIPWGGHEQPKPIEGDSTQWKKAQKKLKKNIISETINKIIPSFIPNCTLIVWCPSKVASVIMSVNHLNK
jgi:hypothetical protein